MVKKNVARMHFEFLDMGSLDPIQKQSLLEKHLISPDFLEESRPSALLKTQDEKISIMINEEDHLRIQCIFSGV
jgi:protein arginine kinase